MKEWLFNHAEDLVTIGLLGMTLDIAIFLCIALFIIN